MSLNERLEFLLNVNAEGAIKGFKAVGDEAEKHLTKAQSGIDKTGATMTKVGSGMVVGAGLIGTGLLELSKKWEESALSAGKLSAATGLTVEQASRWQVVAKGADVDTGTLATSLGKMDKAIEKTPQKFAELGAQIVRTKDGAIDTQATFLNVVDALQKAGGAANNANTATAILGKGWQGMSEILKQSSGDLKTQLESVNKAQIFNDSSVKQAEAFRATMKELSNTVQGLAMSLGKSALPVIEDVTKALTAVAKGFSALNDATGGMVGKFAAMGAVGLGMIGTLSAIGGQAIKMRKAFVDTSEEGVTSLTRLGVAAKGVGIALGVAAVAMTAYTLQQNLNAANNKNFTSSLDAVTKATDGQAVAITEHLIKAWKWADDAKPEDLAKRIAKENVQAAIKVRDLAVANSDYAATLAKTGVTTDMLTAAINGQLASQKQVTDATEKSKAAADALTSSTDTVAVSADNAQNSMQGYSYAAKDLADATREAAAAATVQAYQNAELIKSETGVVAAHQAELNAEQALIDQGRVAVDAKWAYHKAQLATTIAIEDSTKKLKDHKLTQNDAQTAIITGTDAAISQGNAFIAMQGHTKDAEAANKDMITSLYATATALDPANPIRQSILAYIGDLNAIPAQVSTTISYAFLDNGAPGTHHDSSTPAVVANLAPNTPAAVTSWSGVARHATGTTNAEDAFIAGEDGPELVTGRKGATVFTNKKTRQLLGGRGGITLHQTFNGITDVAELTRQSSRALRWELIKG